MKIYEVTLDAWHGYSGLFSSVEKACEILPNCNRFNRALDYCKPSHESKGDKEYSPNWEINKNIKPVLEKEGSYLNVYLPGFTIDVIERVQTPEIKEEGKPYVAAKIDRKKVDSIVKNDVIAKAYIQTLELDITKEY